MQQTDHPFFRPVWRRAAVILACLVWSAVEWWHGETFWGILTLAIAVWGVWVFFLNYRPSGEEAAPSRPD